MNKLNVHLFALILPGILLLASCGKDEGYSLDKSSIAMATVERDNGSSPYLLLDNGATLWISASQVPYMELPAGQRMVANFTLLADNKQGFDYWARLNDYYLVLTKNIIKLDEANQDSIGNDKIAINQIWVGGNYLNIKFTMYLPSKEKHMVNLADNTIKGHPDDGYAHLDFRYNAMGDENTGYITRQLMVSFYLGDSSPGNKALKGLKITYSNRKTGKEEVLTLDYPVTGKDKRQEFGLQGLGGEGNVS